MANERVVLREGEEREDTAAGVWRTRGRHSFDATQKTAASEGGQRMGSKRG